jgi:hypothetical protein
MIYRQDAEVRNPFVADIFVRGEGGWPVALVEVKNRPGMTPEVAAAIRRNLVVHGMVSQQVPYFLVVSQDTGLLWVQRRSTLPDNPPTVEFPMGPVISHYARWLAPDERLSGSALEFLLANWLSDLATGIGPVLAEATDPLTESGFLEGIIGSTVIMNERV